jgi:hypothetical protein
MIVDNVHDGRRGYIGSWIAEPLIYEKLCWEDVGRTVIYQKCGGGEAGTLNSWRDGIVFARYTRGGTAAGASAADLVFGLRPLDTPEDILSAKRRK